ncbi:MAG: rod shape-determining protein MreD [Pelagimonas sp.]|jgi:rod shape-determining protein MreD|nr:rod shape-determining protein MreD [Pelagimonas sp.]
MAETTPTRLWVMRLTYLALALLIILAHLLPIRLGPMDWAGPDVLLALSFAWALRRPDFIPAPLVALALLLADLLLMRPPGLWAALGLLAVEWLKGQGKQLRDNTFFTEWITVAAATLAVAIGYRLVLGILVVSPGAFLLSVQQFGLTVLCYPLVAAASYLIFGVRQITPGEYDH